MDDLDGNSVPSPSESPPPSEGDAELEQVLKAEPEGVCAGIVGATGAAEAAAGAGAATAATGVKEPLPEVQEEAAASLKAEADDALDAASAPVWENEEEVPTLPDLTTLGRPGPKVEVEEGVKTSDGVKVLSSSNPPTPAPAPAPTASAPAAPSSGFGSGFDFDPQAVKQPKTEDGKGAVFSKVEPGSEAQTGRPAEASGDLSRSPRAERKRSTDILMNAVPRHIRRKVFDADISEVIEQCHKLRPETWPDPTIPGGGGNPDLLRRLPDRNALEKLSDRMLQSFLEDARGTARARVTSSTEAFCATHDLSPDVCNALFALPEALQYRVRNAGAVVGFNKDAVVMWRINRVLQGACAESKPPRDMSEFAAENWLSRATVISVQEVDPQVREIVLSQGPLYGPSAYSLLQERITRAEERVVGDIEKSKVPPGGRRAAGRRSLGPDSRRAPQEQQEQTSPQQSHGNLRSGVPRTASSRASLDQPAQKHKKRRINDDFGTLGSSSALPAPGRQAPGAPAKRPSGGLIDLEHSVGPELRPQYLPGLKNLGNTCYMNAVLQAFALQREFVEELLLMRSKFQGCQERYIFTYSAELLEKLSKLQNRARALDPVKLREKIVANYPPFEGNRQQDSHEFLLVYSNRLHDELVDARRETLADQGLDLENLPQGLALATETYLDCQVEKVLDCTTCGASRSLHEQFRDFSLDLTASRGGNVCRLTDMLRSYFSPEAVEAQCEMCRASSAMMGKRLTHAPRTLVLHIKRFVPNLAQQRYDKQHQRVEFPDLLDLRNILASDAVDLKANPATASTAAAAAAAETRDGLLNVARPFLRREACDPGSSLTGQPASSSSSGLPTTHLPPPPRAIPLSDAEDDIIMLPVQLEQPSSRRDLPPLSYRLRSVVSHQGSSPHSGHYVCYGRGADAKWRLFDDDTVREMPPDFNLARLSSEAYILFYTLDSR